MLLKDEENRTSNFNIETEFNSSKIERKTVHCNDLSDRFYTVSRDFSKQYAHIYSARLNTFRELLSEKIEQRWSKKYPVLRLCELREKEQKCIVIGTLFKNQQLKPSILKELSDQLEILPQPVRTHFVHEDDTLVLEDELQRIRLSGDCINVHNVVTGVVCALLGSENEDGIFHTQEFLWPEPSIQKSLADLSDDCFIVLTSGLNLASRSAENQFSLHLMLEWISGVCGNSKYQEEVAKIARLIIAGGIYSHDSSGPVLNENDVVAASEEVDNLCAAISSVTDIDLMPGTKDPSGVMIPQKPFHYCLFPNAVQFESFRRVSNPYECEIEGRSCLGTSGETIKDILRYSKIETALEAMVATLQWRHISPTAPDTMPCAPCIDTDPFTMITCPHIYFMGGNDKFETTLYEGPDSQKVRVVCVPDFSVSKTVAIVNLRNLDCTTMVFGSIE